MPVYDIPGNHRGNFDDAPTVDEPLPKIILVYPLEGMDMCSCGSAQYMATATDSTL